MVDRVHVVQGDECEADHVAQAAKARVGHAVGVELRVHHAEARRDDPTLVVALEDEDVVGHACQEVHHGLACRDGSLEVDLEQLTRSG